MHHRDLPFHPSLLLNQPLCSALSCRGGGREGTRDCTGWAMQGAELGGGGS